MNKTDNVLSCPAAALHYASELDWVVFPAPPGEKKSYKSAKFSNGKNWGVTKDPEEIKRDFKKWPKANVGIPTGVENGFFVVEADTLEGHKVDGIANLQRLIDANGPLPETRMARSPTGSIHYFFNYPAEGRIPNSASKLVPGVDVRGEGGMVVAPPSVKPGVGIYEWLNETDIADAPQWLLDLVIEKESEGAGADQHIAAALIARAIKIIPNDDLDWESWNKRAMAIFAATKGSDDGFKAFDLLSQKSAKYDAAVTRAKWDDLIKTPPDRIGAGYLFKLADEASPGWRGNAISLSDFIAYSPQHTYIFIPTRELWPAASVNSRIAKIPLLHSNGEPQLDDKDKPKFIQASTWLDQNRAVEQMTWAPGEGMEIRDRLVADGGWIERDGSVCFNLYRPPTIIPGDASKATKWIGLVEKVYPDDAEHFIDYCAHCVQHPQIKINHSILMGGDQGIGKDTMLEPLKRAIGPWNFIEISPKDMDSQFNGYLKSVILRISEAHDLGDISRYQFYERMKTLTASPPDVHRINEKFLKEHYILNCNGTVITSNHKTDGIFLPADDRRNYVMWSETKREEFDQDYWDAIWNWYNSGGDRDIAAYLATKDISAFNPKKPPKQTEAFHAIVNSNRAPEESELADVLDALGRPGVVTLAQIADAAGEIQFFGSGIKAWIEEPKNRRYIPHRLEDCGYVQLRNPDAKDDGMWSIAVADPTIRKRRRTIYADRKLSPRDQIAAARAYVNEMDAKAAPASRAMNDNLMKRIKSEPGGGLSRDPADNRDCRGRGGT